MLVAPSILSANFGRLEEEIIAICNAGSDLIHIDVMDGYFVPNMTIGPVVIESIIKIVSKPIDIHLMVKNNSFFVDLFAKYQPKYISFHYESESHHHRIIQKIRDYGISPAIVLNPATSISVIEEIIKYVDMVLLMSVNPGFGGQEYLNIEDKIKRLKDLIEAKNKNCLIEVDGGINDKNIKKLKEAGVDIVVAGSYIFKNDYKKAIKSLKI